MIESITCITTEREWFSFYRFAFQYLSDCIDVAHEFHRVNEFLNAGHVQAYEGVLCIQWGDSGSYDMDFGLRLLEKHFTDMDSVMTELSYQDEDDNTNYVRRSEV